VQPPLGLRYIDTPPGICYHMSIQDAHTRSIVILGAGTAGTIMANKLARALDTRWTISIVDKDPVHYYQPGFLFIPFGIYSREDVVAPKLNYIPGAVQYIQAEVEAVEPAAGHVKLQDGRSLGYDYLVIATGTQPNPAETEGMLGPLWGKEVHEFYTLDGALKLTEALKTFKGGRLVMNVAEVPIKCPVAPLEFVFLADWWLRQRGLREKTQIDYVTPLPGAFTRPIAARALGDLLERKGIRQVPDFSLAAVDQGARTISDWGGRELSYDMLVSVPVNMGDPALARSGLGDEYNYVATERHTLRAKHYENIFVLGDATDLPTSKAGSVAHFAADTALENILLSIKGQALELSFEGHANCFIESGDGRGILIDFNYDTEPLPGVFPYAGIGPFSLLKETRMNHWAKMGFRWIYWNLLLPGRYIPIPSRMSMQGKWRPQQAAAV
jgi:sulfide:quinone oxidoreductase